MKVISETAYRMMENVVGEENISNDPALLDAYWTSIFPDTILTYPLEKPEAVVLPGSTEEVQALVKICNRFKIPYVFAGKLMAWHSTGMPLVMDGKRMNRIIEINEKNMYAIVEPYVIHGQLQAEAMKRGLVNNVPSVGCSGSVIANYIGHAGQTALIFSQSHNSRNVLAAEWVLPTGEIIRLGSLGSVGEWFIGDGPGPSLRGILRGVVGTHGGMGVVTKLAVKLFPWFGPPKLPVEPYDETWPIIWSWLDEKKYLSYMVEFDSYEKLADFIYEVGKNEIGISLGKGFMPRVLKRDRARFVFPIGREATWERWQENYATPPTKEYSELGARGLLRDLPTCPLEYQLEVLKQIVAETGGKLITHRAIGDMFRVGGKGGSMGGGPPGAFQTQRFSSDSVEHCLQTIRSALKVEKPFMEEGLIWDRVGPGRDDQFTFPHEFSHYACNTFREHFDPLDPKSREGITRLFFELAKDSMRIGTHDTFFFGDDLNKMWGPKMSNFHIWMMKIKKAFDPNNVSNPPGMIIPE